MNIRFQKSGRTVGDDQAMVGTQPMRPVPDVENSGRKIGESGHSLVDSHGGVAALEIPGSDAGEGGLPDRVFPTGFAALNPSGPRVGDEQATNPETSRVTSSAVEISARESGAAEATGTSYPRLRTLQRQKSALQGGEDRIRVLSPPKCPTSDPQNSASNGGGEQANEVTTPSRRASAAKSSPRKAGASDAVVEAQPRHDAHPGELSGREVGDEQTTVRAQPIHVASAVHPSGASAPGDEANGNSHPTAITPRRKPPGQKAGADRATGSLYPENTAPDPQPSGPTAGASPARRVSSPNVLAQETQFSGETRGDESRASPDTHATNALIAELVQLGRARRDWMKTRVGIELRAIAICRRFCAGDKDQAKVLWKAVRDGTAPDEILFAVGPLLGPIASLHEQEKRIDRQMTKLASGHEMAAWAKAIRGFGHAGLAKVIAECGDIGSYRNPSCVWKRMGLAVIGGGRQRRVPGAEALEHGYNAERRAVMWNVGGAVIGGMGRGPRPLVGEDMAARDDLTSYQRLFVARLRLEAERDPEAHARPPVENKETGEFKESFSSHAANRAKRYVEKRLLRDLWIAWRRAGQPYDAAHTAIAGSPTESVA